MKPRILLIGAGAFGIKHLNTLVKLHEKSVIELCGIVVKSQKSKEELQKKYSFPVYAGFNKDLLENIDAVDIATPVETHKTLINTTLPHVNVLVEKPLASSKKEIEEIKKSKNILMIGHIFRFHPAVTKLKEIVSKKKTLPYLINSSFINPISSDNLRDVETELLHSYDIVDFLFGFYPKNKHIENHNRYKIVTLSYPKKIIGIFKLGWKGEAKERSIKLSYKDQHIFCNIEESYIDIFEDGKCIEHIKCKSDQTPLKAEITTFIDLIKSKKNTRSYPDINVGKRIVQIATTGGNKSENKRKKVAIIGGGIFGVNCAVELAPFHDITIFEKNDSIFSEASKINQYRHHWGYHYPRSQETVDDIRLAMKDFEDRYDRAIVRKFPTYYSVSKTNSKVTDKEFKKFCEKNDLPYKTEYPHSDFLDKNLVSTCLKTFEPIYDFYKLKSISETLIKKNTIKLRLNQEIVNAKIEKDGQKTLTIKDKKGRVSKEKFDYVINATYARNNNFCEWLGFRKKPIRIDLVEVLWVKLNIPKISLAVMDGKFTNIVPTGRDGLFTLVHIKESVLRRFVPKNGLVPKDIFSSIKRTRVQKIIDHSAKWFPFVKKAKVLQVHHVLRGVNAYREHDDARISDITEHGFGCYSVFGGKIINSVWIAKQLKEIMQS